MSVAHPIRSVRSSNEKCMTTQSDVRFRVFNNVSSLFEKYDFVSHSSTSSTDLRDTGVVSLRNAVVNLYQLHNCACPSDFRR